MKLSAFQRQQMKLLASGTIKGLDKYRKKLLDWAEEFKTVFKKEDIDENKYKIYSKEPLDFEEAFRYVENRLKNEKDSKTKILLRHFVSNYIEYAKGYVQHAATLAIVYGSKQAYPVLEITGATMNELLDMTKQGWAEELYERMKKEKFDYTKEEVSQISQVCNQLKKKVGPRLIWA